MLRLDSVNAGYGRSQVLFDLSLEIGAGEILCLLGRNGAGKTTVVRAIMGLLPLMSGRILLADQELSAGPAHEVARAGIGYVPQGRRLFAELTVAQNLEIGLMARESGPEVRAEVLDLFPRLQERLHQRAQTLSGGEQQMLAMARALCLRPSVLLLDEPTEGLQPSMITLIRDVIAKMRDEGVTILMVEQRVEAVLALADRVAFLENGRLGAVMSVEELRRDQSLANRFLGI